MKTFVERHAAKIRGTQSCFDRVVITGTLPDIAHAGAMAAYLTAHQVRLFDYPQWAAPLREEIRSHAEQVAREAGLPIEFIQRKDFRKEARIKAILAERGDHPGLVHIFSETRTVQKDGYPVAPRGIPPTEAMPQVFATSPRTHQALAVSVNGPS